MNGSWRMSTTVHGVEAPLIGNGRLEMDAIEKTLPQRWLPPRRSQLSSDSRGLIVASRPRSINGILTHGCLTRPAGWSICGQARSQRIEPMPT